MDYSVNKELSKEDIWMWLSEIFCRGIEDYAYIAKHLTKTNIDELERKYFEVVAPVCYEFIQPYPVDPDITQFDETWLVGSIKKRLASRESSVIRRVAGDLYIKYLRKVCAADWNAFKQAYLSALAKVPYSQDNPSDRRNHKFRLSPQRRA